MRFVRRSRSAIATVEFALSLPLLLVLMLGVWEIARYVEVQQIVNNAAREAGRQAAGGSKSVAEIRQSVSQYLQSAGLTPNGFELSVTNLTNPSSRDPREAYNLDALEIVLSLPYRNVNLSLTSLFIPSSARIRSRVVWRSLRDLPVVVDVNPPVE
ncbi:MAG: TadE/TadG family type IV pilus assembly protein [Gemmatales bacterium]|nr:pilus assembly protein [Gemmatales bacterium]MDW7993754.1 TadE/TadG family type IV pilus assembly protein [Gemmatales bacterium]